MLLNDNVVITVTDPNLTFIEISFALEDYDELFERELRIAGLKLRTTTKQVSTRFPTCTIKDRNPYGVMANTPLSEGGNLSSNLNRDTI